MRMLRNIIARYRELQAEAYEVDYEQVPKAEWSGGSLTDPAKMTWCRRCVSLISRPEDGIWPYRRPGKNGYCLPCREGFGRSAARRARVRHLLRALLPAKPPGAAFDFSERPPEAGGWIQK